MQIDDLIKQFNSSNIRALAKILTIIESRQPGFEKIMSKIAGHKKQNFCLGITGPPGAGKSTLVDSLTHILRKEDLTVGIIAIDPSSPFSGGAVLGDRIRMQDHASDDHVFIRSLGSRGSHGGLSRATRDIVTVMSSFGFDVVIVETVGVGQTELDIMELADTTVVVLVPEAGDTIQTMKAGLLEIADIFVVNKSDRPNADEMFRGLAALVDMNKDSDWTIPILKTEAFKSVGVDELRKTIDLHHKHLISDDKHNSHKSDIRKAELTQITLELIEHELKRQLNENEEFSKLSEEVTSGKTNPYTASMELVDKILKK